MKQLPKDGSVDIQKARSLVFQGLWVEGAHHKQWYLEQIGAALGLDIEWQYEHSKEDPTLAAWQRGVQP